jgi:tetratricopeptide (TPR) repeat protein
MLEIGLRVFDVASPGEFDDSLVGFSKVQPLFELDEDAGTYRTSRARTLFFGVQEFAADKPDNGYRVFCLGGSTVRGRPFEPESAFSKWLELELAGCDPDRKYEVVNCGGLSYASYRLRVLLTEVLQYQPDLIVLCTGHNEFLEDRTYASLKERSNARAWFGDRAASLRILTAGRSIFANESVTSDARGDRTILKGDVDARLDDPTGYSSYHLDSEWQAGVVHHFELSVGAMIQMCSVAEVPVILVLPGANLRDNAPFKSEHPPELTADRELAWQRAFDAGAAVDDPEQALAEYRIAEAIDDGYALLSFRMARCLDQVGRHNEARRMYRKAKNDDVCPLRILDGMCDILTRIAEDTNTPLVDARTLFISRSSDGIPGSDWYTDHVHPTIYGHQQIAQAVVDTMQREGWPVPMTRWSPGTRRAIRASHLRKLGSAWFANGRRRVGWLEAWARRQRLLEETTPVDARGFLHRGCRRYGFDEPVAAWADFDEAINRDPSTETGILNFAFRLFDQGRPTDAAEVVDALNERASPLIEFELRLAQYVLASARKDETAAARLLSDWGAAFKHLEANSTPWQSVQAVTALMDSAE